MGDLLKCTGDCDDPNAEHLLRRFFAAGQRCYVVETPGQIVGYCWLFFRQYVITHDSYQTSSVLFSLSEHSVFIGNVFIRPECRRRGLYSSLLSGVLREAKSSYGKNRFYVDVKADNAPSLRAHSQAGFTIVATLYYVGLLGARFLVMAPTKGRPRVHRATNDPVMTL
jgi:L-amino acid N-acyltransferase YncA